MRTRDILIAIRERELIQDANFTELDTHLRTLYLRDMNKYITKNK